MHIFGRKLKACRQRGSIQLPHRKPRGLRTKPSYYYANTSNYNVANVASQVTPLQRVCSHHEVSYPRLSIGALFRARHLGSAIKLYKLPKHCCFIHMIKRRQMSGLQELNTNDGLLPLPRIQIAKTTLVLMCLLVAAFFPSRQLCCCVVWALLCLHHFWLTGGI